MFKVQDDEASFHKIHDKDMNKRLSRTENPNFSFRTRASLGITEELALGFTMDVVPVRKRLVCFLDNISGEWLAGNTVGL